MGTIGQKVKRIRIERAVETPDGHGGHSTAWTVRCVVNAHERPLTGAEALRAAQVTAVISSVWEIWYRTDIAVTDRIRFGTRVLNIESIVDPTDTREELQLFCSEVQGAVAETPTPVTSWIQQGWIQ